MYAFPGTLGASHLMHESIPKPKWFGMTRGRESSSHLFHQTHQMAVSTAGMGAGQSDRTHPAALRLSYSMVGSALEAPPLPSLLTPSLPPLSFLPFWSHALSFPSLLHPAFLFRILVHMWIPPLVHACGLLPPPESSPWAITMPLICSIEVGWIGVQVSTIWGLWKKQVGQWGAFIQG